MTTPQCLECRFLLKIVDQDDLRCNAFPYGISSEILSNSQDHQEPCPGDHGLRFEPIAPERQHQDAEFHQFAVKLRRLQREIVTSEKLTEEQASLAGDALLAWAAGKPVKEWIRERKISAAEAQRLKDGGCGPGDDAYVPGSS